MWLLQESCWKDTSWWKICRSKLWAALELNSVEIITGQNSILMSAASAMVINAIKKLVGILDKIYLLASNIISRVKNLKKMF